MTRMKKVFIDTNGCEEAKLDAQKLKNFVCWADCTLTNDARLADIIVFYACGHLQGNEKESLSIIRRLISLKKSSAIFVVWGCLPEISPEAIQSIYKGPLVGPENWDFFNDLLNQPKEKMPYVSANRWSVQSKLVRPALLSVRGVLSLLRDGFNYQYRKIWYIKVESGCEEACTYCSDHLAFKCFKSQPMDAIISQFRLGLQRGFRCFFLVGRNLGSYGHDIDSDLPTLLNRMVESHPGDDYSFSLYNMSPKSLVEFYPRLRSLFSSGRVHELGSHIQSGSDRILTLMGRKLSIHEWISVMKDISKNYPSIRLVTSIMVGFPTETEQDFNKSMKLLDEVPFDQVDSYAYAERPNLPSLRLSGRMPNKVKESRSKKVARKTIIIRIVKKMRRFQIFSVAQIMVLYSIDLILSFDERRQRNSTSSHD
jgi:MiaB/RimO family radical SAM methylthiotransferase